MAKKKRNTKAIPMLPQVMTMVKQPNRVTYARIDYTLQQQKVFFYIIKQLQEPINEQLQDRAKQINQLTLFQDSQIQIKIPLKDLSSPSEYAELIKTIESLRQMSITFPMKDEKGTEYKAITGLILEAYVPNSDYKKDVIITLNRVIAENLVRLEGGYTKYAFEIISRSKCKYTPRIYQLISRWRDRGGFEISIVEFRDWLMLGDKYKDFKELKKRVLQPVFDELFEKSDVWFEVDKITEGSKVVRLKFKVITTDKMKVIDSKKDNIIQMLKIHFGFNKDHIEEITYLLNKPNLIQEISNKLLELHEYITSNGQISNVPAYTIKTLKNAFKARI